MRGRLLAVLLGVAVVVTGCSVSSSGDRVAAQQAEAAMLALADDLTPLYGEAQDAERLAVQAAEHPAGQSEGATVEVLSWSGNSAVGQGGASLDIRIDVHVEAFSDGLVFGRSYSEGDATRCWHVRLFARNYDEYELSEFACPSEAAPPLPTPTPLPTMPPDVDERITTVLAAATPADLEQLMREAVPDERITVDARAEGGELIVAVGLPHGEACVVGVRHADRSVELLRGWQREWLQPGETGCAVGLYLNPPR